MTVLTEFLAHPLIAGLVLATLGGTATAATTTCVLTLRNYRLLRGETGVGTDDGLLGDVRELEAGQELHHRALLREGILEARTDGGDGGSEQ